MSPAGEVSVELEAERARLALLITFILTGLVFRWACF
jgi:hypothetical protein